MSKVLVTQDGLKSVNFSTQPYIAVLYAGTCCFCNCQKSHYFDKTIREARVSQHLKLGGGDGRSLQRF